MNNEPLFRFYSQENIAINPRNVKCLCCTGKGKLEQIKAGVIDSTNLPEYIKYSIYS